MIHPPRKKLLRLLFVLIVCALAPVLFLLQGSSSDLAVSGSGKDGIIEQSRYVFAWNGITAAVAEYTLTRRIVEGRPTLHFTGRARTTEGIDLFWRMRDSVLALIDGATLAPRRFQLFRRENEKRIDLDVVHDLEEEKFASVGDAFLMGCVLNELLADHVSLNSFNQLSVKLLPSQREFSWLPRAGKKTII